MFSPNCLPNAIPESEYVAPVTQILTRNDQRKNWSDIQETAQRMRRTDVPRRLMENLQIGGPSSEPRLISHF